jgi:hypothetical protein
MTPSRVTHVLLALLLLVAAAQLIRPGRINPPIDRARDLRATASVPAGVDAVLRRSCYDCHSNETRWPWYSAVAPIAWGVAKHVQDGRAAMNFSEWGTYASRKRTAMLERLCDEVRKGEMPLASYLLLHREATLTEVEWKSICDWSADEADRLGRR